MASNNYIYKMSNAGGLSSITRYVDMLAGNTTWNPWQPAGAYDALATVTVPSGGAADVTFAGIPAGYKHLQIRALGQTNRATYPIDDLYFNFNSDTSASYTYHYLWGTGSGSANAGANTAATNAQVPACFGTQVSGSWWGSAVIDILDYASTNKNKTMRTLSGVDINGNTIGTLTGRINFISNLWQNTSAINTIKITSNATFQQYTTFALYGIK